MADDPLTTAKDLRKQLLEEKARALEALAGLESLIAQLDAVVAGMQRGAVGSVVDTARSARMNLTAKSNRNPKKEEVARMARTIIEEHGRPIPRDDLFDYLLDNGVVISGANPQMVLSTMLWRAGEDAGVVRLKRGGGGYWLKEKPWPEAGYDPDQLNVFD